MLIKLLTKVFGSRNDRTLRRMRKVVNIINAMEPEMEKTLRRRTERENRRVSCASWKKAKCWKNLIPEAIRCGCVKPVRRVFGMRHFDVSYSAVWFLTNAASPKCVPVKVKTLTATLPAYLNALTGKGVHVVTVNDYLAQRDAEKQPSAV